MNLLENILKYIYNIIYYLQTFMDMLKYNSYGGFVMNEIGNNIYRLRKERNLTQAELASALRMDELEILRWENNTAMPLANQLITIADYFQITIDELLRGSINGQMQQVQYQNDSNMTTTVNSKKYESKSKILVIKIVMCSLIGLYLLMMFVSSLTTLRYMGDAFITSYYFVFVFRNLMIIISLFTPIVYIVFEGFKRSAAYKFRYAILIQSGAILLLNINLNSRIINIIFSFLILSVIIQGIVYHIIRACSPKK